MERRLGIPKRAKGGYQGRNRIFDVGLIYVTACWQEGDRISGQEFKFAVTCSCAEYRHRQITFDGIFCQTVNKWHIIFVCLQITKGTQIRQGFIHDADNIWHRAVGRRCVVILTGQQVGTCIAVRINT